MAPKFFPSPEAFRAWLATHAASAKELVVGFHKRATGKPCMTWSESVDEALCQGWIDGVRTGIDADTYQIRFTPRRPGSNWSAINIAKVEKLEAQGRMTAAGREAFAQRREDRSAIYSYEQRAQATLSTADAARFRANKAAWKFFQAQPPGYRQQMLYRVASAKREATRQSRLARLIAASERGERLP